MIPQVSGFQGCYLDDHRNNWRCARAVQKRPLSAGFLCLDRPPPRPLGPQVQFFLDELFDDMDAHSEEAPIPMQQFLEWGLQSELVNNILHGFEMQYVRLCPAEESVELREETYHQDPNIGRIELDELQGK